MSLNSNRPWTDEELAGAVEAYIFLLLIERADLPYPIGSAAKIILSRQLASRNDASLRYRMRNISAVVKELGGPVLRHYSPAERVGAGVRVRLRKMLLAHPGFNQVRRARAIEGADTRFTKAEALFQLDALRRNLNELERETLGIGHNRPPEPLLVGALKRSDFEKARNDIRALEEAIKKGSLRERSFKKYARGLMNFGLKFALWAGERATKFTDAALKISAPIVVAQVSGFTDKIIAALKAVLLSLGQH